MVIMLIGNKSDLEHRQAVNVSQMPFQFLTCLAPRERPANLCRVTAAGTATALRGDTVGASAASAVAAAVDAPAWLSLVGAAARKTWFASTRQARGDCGCSCLLICVRRGSTRKDPARSRSERACLPGYQSPGLSCTSDHVR